MPLRQVWAGIWPTSNKYYQMKKTNFFYHMLIVLGLCGCMFCGNGGENKTDSQAYDSTSNNTDSMNAAHHVDPSNAYPQPPVTGSNQDSSRTKDSSRLRDTPNRPGY